MRVYRRTGVQLIACLLALLSVSTAAAQSGSGEEVTRDGRQGTNLINAGVPFLLIAPDSRAGAMGDAGVATTPDANSTHWNPAKLAFIQDTAGLSLSYSPWLQRLVPDINLAYLSGFYKLDDRNVIGGSLRYFSLGDIEFTQGENDAVTPYNPNEFAIDATYARLFGNLSLGTAIRFIRSNLAGGYVLSSGAEIRPATAIAADASAYFQNETFLLGSDARIAVGLNISNIGNRIRYTSNEGARIPLPTNLKLGSAATLYDDLSEFTFTIDINKLLVPTPPVRDENGKVISGKDDDRSVPAGIFGSFSDAPGGFSEELQEISYSVGSEYWYNRQFALRAGYLYENPAKGNRQYLTLGAGVKYNIFNLDFSYILANQQKSPMANTLRFSLLFSFQ
ncbi:type IX secretion system outer membrane channel protein PorV [Pedobacter sp. SYSU D00535]|uniref:type IX secretion system outer membrane channel protein PorV n=1 Tax=Pedobacter sp. SYSU D00535 TaxID=2810308 RepID=UPI001A965CED|nr:type IX secretion system outer membrane channel protein PorV [Pedobacter sp. SYSU D00535]